MDHALMWTGRPATQACYSASTVEIHLLCSCPVYVLPVSVEGEMGYLV